MTQPVERVIAPEAPAELERPRLRARRRRWVPIAITLAVAAQASVAYLALTRTPGERVITRVEESRTTTVLAIPTPPVMVPLPVAAPPTIADTRACPPPRTDAPHLVPGEIPEDVTNLAVSPTNAGWIAAWNDADVFVSTDAGKTFRRKLDGNGHVLAAQFDCFGHIVVVRGAQIGIADGPREVWRSIPGLAIEDEPEPTYHDRVSLIGGGRDVIVVGNKPGDTGGARVAVSRDLGASWAYHDMNEYSAAGETVTGVQHEDGTILVGTTIADCRTEDIAWLRITPDGKAEAHWQQIYGVQFQFWGDSMLSTYGRRKIDAPEDTTWAAYPEETYYGIPIPAPYPVFVTDEKIVRLTGTKTRDLPWKPEGEHLQMDPAGRVWSIVCGKPWIAGKTASGRSCGVEGA